MKKKIKNSTHKKRSIDVNDFWEKKNVKKNAAQANQHRDRLQRDQQEDEGLYNKNK